MQSSGGEKGTKVAIILINLPTKLKDVSFPSSTWWNKEPDELHTISQMKQYEKAHNKNTLFVVSPVSRHLFSYFIPKGV